MLPFWAVALLGFLIVARCTRFLNSDYLAGDLRAWVMERFGDGKIYYLVTCPWCASIWLGLPVAIVAVTTLSPYDAWPSIWAIGGLWCGMSWLYGLVASNLDDE